VIEVPNVVDESSW